MLSETKQHYNLSVNYHHLQRDDNIVCKLPPSPVRRDNIVRKVPTSLVRLSNIFCRLLPSPVRTNNIVFKVLPSAFYSQSLTYCRTELLTFSVGFCPIAIACGCILTVVFTSNKL